MYVIHRLTTYMWSLCNIFLHLPAAITPFVTLSADQSIVQWACQLIVSSKYFNWTISTLFFQRDDVFYLLCTRAWMVLLLRNTHRRFWHIDWKNPTPLGGFSIYYVLWSRAVCKRFHDEMRPSHLVVKSLTHGSWSGNIINRNPSRGGGVLSINIGWYICLSVCVRDHYSLSRKKIALHTPSTRRATVILVESESTHTEAGLVGVGSLVVWFEACVLIAGDFP